jgi:hypothetical protein
MMKAVTKAKRRVTLSICGLGMLDETEVDSVPGATPYPELISSESSAVYRSWKSPADAIAWATTIILTKPQHNSKSCLNLCHLLMARKHLLL